MQKTAKVRDTIIAILEVDQILNLLQKNSWSIDSFCISAKIENMWDANIDNKTRENVG